jgi:hypothetical protein
MGCCLSQFDLGESDVVIEWRRRGRGRCTSGDLAHAQRNLGDEFPTGYLVEFLNKRRLEERELVQPDTVADQEVELLIANLVGPGVRGDGFPDDRDPVPAHAVFEQLGFKAQATSHPFEDAGERVDGTDSTHGGIIAKNSVAISSQ